MRPEVSVVQPHRRYIAISARLEWSRHTLGEYIGWSDQELIMSDCPKLGLGGGPTCASPGI